MIKNLSFASIATSAGILATGAIGPTTQAAEPESSVRGAIEEVLVTARRREESLQDVPIAISAFGGADLEDRGIERVENMNAVAPNLSVMGGVNSGESQANFRVRGMPGVAVYVDGVDQPTTDGLFSMAVVEVDRIEVLRGPQGTLFGNSSLGGAVHYVTRPPADSFGARIGATVGSFNRKDVQAAVDLPLSGTFKSKFTVSSQNSDGFVHSRFIDESYGDVNDELYRADFLWEPVEAVSVRYNAEATNVQRKGPARQTAELAPTNTAVIGGKLFNLYQQGQIYANIGIPFNNATQVSGHPGGLVGENETNVAWRGNGIDMQQIRHSLDLNWTISDAFRVRSISGYKELRRYTQTDLDGSAEVTILDRETGAKLYSFGQELQLVGSHEKVDWVLGGFYQEQYNRNRTDTRALSELTCDMWANHDIAARNISIAQQADCFNLRMRALQVSSLVANSSMTRAQIQALNTQVATAPDYNPDTNGGVNLTQFAGAVTTNSDVLTVTRPETKAVFGDITWRATDKLTIAAGLRYSKDTAPTNVNVGSIGPAGSAARHSLLSYNGMNLEGDLRNFFAFRDLPAPTGKTEFDALTKRLTLQYHWTPELMTYVSYSDGYQPGGTIPLAQIVSGMITLNAQGVATGGYLRDIYNAGLMDVPLSVSRDEQTVKNYEIGLRADWLGGALRTNVTAFFTDWRNVPVTQYPATRYWDVTGDGFADTPANGGLVDLNGDGVPDPFFFPSLFTTAVDKAEASGVELEVMWRATDALRFNMNIGYLKTEYKELGAAGLGVVPALQSGTPFAGAPDFTANVSGQYEIPLAAGAAIIPRVDYTFTDDYTLNTGEQNQRIQEGFGLLNARVVYDSGAAWRLSVFGNNLTDERYWNSGLYSAADRVNFVTIGRPREWGMTLDFRFE